MPLLRKPAPSDVFFRGRPGDPRMGEWVEPVEEIEPRRKKNEAVLIGYPDDQGVTQNRGRAGAAAGPDSIRKEFYKLTPPADFVWEKNFSLFDFGNITVSSRLEETHSHAEQLAEEVARAGKIAIALGGGHDFAAATFRGFQKTAPKARWGLINIDPHLDTREMEGSVPHSGNPFRALLEAGILKGPDLTQFGARANRNSRSSWKYCVTRKVNIVPLEVLRAQKSTAPEQFQKQLAKLSRSCAHLGVTLDMDCCFEAEGVSAAPVLGFSAAELCAFGAIAGKNRKVRYLEIAEVAPLLESNQRTSRIAAEVIFAFLRARVGLG